MAHFLLFVLQIRHSLGKVNKFERNYRAAGDGHGGSIAAEIPEAVRVLSKFLGSRAFHDTSATFHDIGGCIPGPLLLI